MGKETVSDCCCLMGAAFTRAGEAAGRAGCIVCSDKGLALCLRNPSLFLQMVF